MTVYMYSTCAVTCNENYRNIHCTQMLPHCNVLTGSSFFSSSLNLLQLNSSTVLTVSQNSHNMLQNCTSAIKGSKLPVLSPTEFSAWIEVLAVKYNWYSWVNLMPVPLTLQVCIEVPTPLDGSVNCVCTITAAWSANPLPLKDANQQTVYCFIHTDT